MQLAMIGLGLMGASIKMVHNGIEYSLMTAYAEGLKRAAPSRVRPVRHETA